MEKLGRLVSNLNSIPSLLAQMGMLVVLSVVLLPGCTRDASQISQPGITARDTGVEGLHLTSDQKNLVQRFRDQGGLRVGILAREGVESTISNARTNPTMPGLRRFNLLLIDEITRVLDLPLSITEVTISEVFGQEGNIPSDIRTNSQLRYTPDVLKQNDLFIGSLTPLPWRTRLMDFIPVFPSQVVVVTRNELSGMPKPELGRLSMVLPEGLSYWEYYQRLAEIYDFVPNFRYMDEGEDVLASVIEGRADATLADSIEAVGLLRIWDDLTILEPITNIQYESWAVAKGSLVLNNLIRQTIDQLKDQGVYNQLFLQSFGFDVNFYYSLIGFNPGDDVSQLSLTLEELAYVQALQARGGIHFATFETPESYQPQPDGSIGGFDYNLAVTMARVLGVDFSFTVLPGIRDFFTLNGDFDPRVMRDKSMIYTPDVFSRADVLVAPFAVNEWRQRLARFITLYPAGVVIVGKDAHRLTRFQDLDGMRVALPPGGFQEPLLDQLASEHNISVEFVYYPTGGDVFQLLRENRADITIDGSVFLARGMGRIGGLSVSPLSLTLIPVGWAVQKDNRILAGIIEKFVQLALSNGSVHRFWTKANGVDFDYYLHLITGN